MGEATTTGYQINKKNKVKRQIRGNREKIRETREIRENPLKKPRKKPEKKHGKPAEKSRKIIYLKLNNKKNYVYGMFRLKKFQNLYDTFHLKTDIVLDRPSLNQTFFEFY
jgi:hypothetical protein